jgi:hypothetical protein
VVAGSEQDGRESTEGAEELLVDGKRINEDHGSIPVHHGVGVTACTDALVLHVPVVDTGDDLLQLLGLCLGLAHLGKARHGPVRFPGQHVRPLAHREGRRGA